ncbi:hypothetical protein BH23CHL4_BH23CHL4_03450 [soil metagenome]
MMPTLVELDMLMLERWHKFESTAAMRRQEARVASGGRQGGNRAGVLVCDAVRRVSDWFGASGQNASPLRGNG